MISSDHKYVWKYCGRDDIIQTTSPLSKVQRTKIDWIQIIIICAERQKNPKLQIPLAFKPGLHISPKDRKHMVAKCTIKIFETGGGAGVLTPSRPLPHANNLCLYSPLILRRFENDSLLILRPTPPHFKHLSPSPPPHHPPPAPPINIFIVHKHVS